MRRTIIVACDSKGGIGSKGTLPWNCKEDLQFFKDMTYGHAVIMGRKTYESIGQPLPARTNFVVSASHEMQEEGAKVEFDFDVYWTNTLSYAFTEAEIYQRHDWAFVIGGAQLYKTALEDKNVNEIIMSRIDDRLVTEVPDTFFPVWPVEDAGWELKRTWIPDGRVGKSKLSGRDLEQINLVRWQFFRRRAD